MDAAAGAVEEVARVIARIRARWPRTRILLRADSGFARGGMMEAKETAAKRKRQPTPPTPPVE